MVAANTTNTNDQMIAMELLLLPLPECKKYNNNHYAQNPPDQAS